MTIRQINHTADKVERGIEQDRTSASVVICNALPLHAAASRREEKPWRRLRGWEREKKEYAGVVRHSWAPTVTSTVWRVRFRQCNSVVPSNSCSRCQFSQSLLETGRDVVVNALSGSESQRSSQRSSVTHQRCRCPPASMSSTSY